MKILNTILDVLFPVNCVICKKEKVILCEKCLFLCPQTEKECAKWIYPLYDYRNIIIKKTLWFLKYRNKKNIAKVFAQIMHKFILEELSDLSSFENFKNPILIPIPLSKKRQKERGYNQAELICEELLYLSPNNNSTLKSDFILEKNILIKNKDTKHQANIKNRSERLLNLKDSFTINKEAISIKNRNIILIDDITTTGATLNEAKKTLKKAGARKIIAFTVAH